MIAETSGLKVNVYKESMTPDALASLRRTLAKRANQRLVRLERASSKVTQETYAGIGASEIAYDYLDRQKSGKKRFTEAKDAAMSYDQMRREVTVLQNFLSSKSSLVSGMREIENTRLNTFESGKWGAYARTGKLQRKLKFANLKEFYQFFNSSQFAELKRMGFSSEQIIESYDEAKETYKGSEEEAMDAMEEALKQFREKGRGDLKSLRRAAGGKPLK